MRDAMAEAGHRAVNGKATMRDVAARAGVSTATVSRVLSRPGLVAEVTRQAVLAAIEETGFLINQQARNLRRQRTGTVVVVLPDISNPFFSDVIEGLHETAQAAGYSVLIGDTHGDPVRLAEYFDAVASQRADGVIALQAAIPRRLLEDEARRRATPLVMACEYLPGAGIPTVRIDNVAAAEGAVLHLAALGHRRIAHLAGPQSMVLGPDRHAGYLRALRGSFLPVEDGLVAEGDFSIASGEALTAGLLRQAEPPTAIFASNDEMALGALIALAAAGLKVPDDVSVVGFDDIRFARTCTPALTTVHQPRRAIGELAMAKLLAVIAGLVPAQIETVLPAELVERGSTAVCNRLHSGQASITGEKPVARGRRSQ